MPGLACELWSHHHAGFQPQTVASGNRWNGNTLYSVIWCRVCRPAPPRRAWGHLRWWAYGLPTHDGSAVRPRWPVDRDSSTGQSVGLNTDRPQVRFLPCPIPLHRCTGKRFFDARISQTMPTDAGLPVTASPGDCRATTAGAADVIHPTCSARGCFFSFSSFLLESLHG